MRRDRRHAPRSWSSSPTARYEQVGTFNGNPLTMAAARAMLLEVLTPEAYAHFDKLRDAPWSTGAEDMLAAVPASRLRAAPFGAKGAVVFSPTGSATTATSWAYDDRWGHAHWLYQHNGGVFLPPWGKGEQWTLSVQHTDEPTSTASLRQPGDASLATCAADRRSTNR